MNNSWLKEIVMDKWLKRPAAATLSGRSYYKYKLNQKDRNIDGSTE